MKFYDRKIELEILKSNEQQSYKSAVFCVIIGRRRIGKTSLVTKALEGEKYAYLYVSKDAEPLLCQHFQETLKEQLGIDIYGTATHFRDVFEAVMKEAVQRHITIVFDEFQNLYKINPAIFSEMQDIWDRYHNDAKINLITLGSMQSLMKRIFEDKNEPLYGRPTSKLTLRPFNVDVITQILSDFNTNFTNEDLLCLYMLTGGVAKYIELLMEAGCYSKDKMLNHVFRQDSYFLTEGKDLLNNEFNSDFHIYFSILQLIAAGKTRRVEIDGVLQRDTGTFLQNLENNFSIIKRIKPLLSRQEGKISSYSISDNFLRFWFRFIYPYQFLIERGQLKLLRENVQRCYEEFTGKTLEQFYHAKYVETGNYTQVGNWWNRKGDCEIDMIAINEFDKTGVIAEIKRNPQKISIPKLKEKIALLPPALFGEYSFSVRALSLNEMIYRP